MDRARVVAAAVDRLGIDERVALRLAQVLLELADRRDRQAPIAATLLEFVEVDRDQLIRAVMVGATRLRRSETAAVGDTREGHA